MPRHVAPMSMRLLGPLELAGNGRPIVVDTRKALGSSRLSRPRDVYSRGTNWPLLDADRSGESMVHLGRAVALIAGVGVSAPEGDPGIWALAA